MTHIKLTFEANANYATLFRPYREGDRREVAINTGHMFYECVYKNASPEIKTAYEILFLTWGDMELRCKGDALICCTKDRECMGERLHHALCYIESEREKE
jgi:hypothetical protein